MFISNINFSLGNLESIDSIEEIESEDQLKTLKTLGLQEFSKSDLSEFELAYSCAEKSINEYASTIDLVIYVSCSLDNHENIKDGFSKLMCDLGLPQVYPIGSFISRCSNLSMALRLASNVLKTESEINSILLVLSDKVNQGEKRVHFSNYISSDASSSCIISKTKPEKSFEILDIEEFVDHSAYSISAEKNFVKYIEVCTLGIENVSRKLMNNLNFSSEDFDHFLCGSYNSSIINNYSRICGFTKEKTFSKNLRNYAHTFSSTCLISLKTMMLDLRKGDKLFLLTTGDIFFGAVALKYE
jgi:3-oxoacyl-[acyl-carrier-protein] synthase III